MLRQLALLLLLLHSPGPSAATGTGVPGSSGTRAALPAPARLPRPHLAQTASGAWSYFRGQAPLRFPIGLNHFFAVTRCHAEDTACQQADLFARRFYNNVTAAATAALEQFRRWGFTAGGYNAPPAIQAELPFFVACFLLGGKYGGPHPWHPTPNVTFPDPWNATTIAGINATTRGKCKETAPYRHNNLGYMLIDFPAYDISKCQEVHGKDWVTALRCAPLTAPGRARYLAFLRAKYADAAALCRAYGLSASLCSAGWAGLDLCSVRNVEHPAMLDDDYEFLPQIPQAIHAAAEASIKACDPDAIILGDTMDMAWTPASVIKAAAARFPALSIQPSGGTVRGRPPPAAAPSPAGRHAVGPPIVSSHFNLSAWAELHSLTGGRPMVVGDLGFAWPQAGFQHYEWSVFSSQADAGEAYRQSVVGAAAAPWIVGFQKCEYIDRATRQPILGLKPGMLAFNGSAHQPFAGLVTAANLNATAQAAV